MDREEYENKYGDREWSMNKINQYAIEINLADSTVKIPTRNIFLGKVAYLPRDEEFELKQHSKLILRFETDYLPVLTPNSGVEEHEDGKFEVDYHGRSDS